MEFPRIEGHELALDFETTGLQYWKPDFRAFGVAVAVAGKEWYWDIRRSPQVVNWLRDLLPGKCVASHNAQFEYQIVRLLGINPRSIKWHCTMVAACLIDEHLIKYDLDSVARYFEVESQKGAHQTALMAALGVATLPEAMSRLADAPLDVVSRYGGSDARICFDLYRAQMVEVERQELVRVLDVEMRLLPVLADMSWGGVRVDLEAAHAAIPALDAKEVTIAAEIKQLTGCADPSVFVNSPKQMREFFKPEPVNKYQWKLIDGTLVGPTKGGKGPSLGQDAMRAMVHPVAANILDLRKTIKLRDTFIRGHVIASADEDGFVHTSFNQTRTDQDAGTVTGRLSSTAPALQQITKRDKANAAILRSMFLPDRGEEWLCADYSQVDFRCAADLINDPVILQAYRDNPKLDYHQVVSDMTGIPRNAAYAGAPNTKQLNLGLAFGAGAGKLSMMMGMPFEYGEWKGRMVFYPGAEAKRIFEQYHTKLPGVKLFMKKAENVAKARGFVKTRIGRRLRFNHAGGEHKAAGLLYQAYAADLHKVGLIAIDSYLTNNPDSGRLLVSVHDEVGVSMPRRGEHVDGIVKAYTDFSRVDSEIQMRVPILASSDFGKDWYQASKG